MYFILYILKHYSEKRSIGFTRLPKGSMAQKQLRTPDLRPYQFKVSVSKISWEPNSFCTKTEMNEGNRVSRKMTALVKYFHKQTCGENGKSQRRLTQTPKCQTVNASLATGNPNLNVSQNLRELKIPLEHIKKLKSC
jgi:hypothetical protein